MTWECTVLRTIRNGSRCWIVYLTKREYDRRICKKRDTKNQVPYLVGGYQSLKPRIFGQIPTKSWSTCGSARICTCTKYPMYTSTYIISRYRLSNCVYAFLLFLVSTYVFLAWMCISLQDSVAFIVSGCLNGCQDYLLAMQCLSPSPFLLIRTRYNRYNQRTTKATNL